MCQEDGELVSCQLVTEGTKSIQLEAMLWAVCIRRRIASGSRRVGILDDPRALYLGAQLLVEMVDCSEVIG